MSKNGAGNRPSGKLRGGQHRQQALFKAAGRSYLPWASKSAHAAWRQPVSALATAVHHNRESCATGNCEVLIVLALWLMYPIFCRNTAMPCATFAARARAAIALLALLPTAVAAGEPARDMLGQARSQTDLGALRGLLDRLEGGKHQNGRPAEQALPEAQRAEELARDLAAEPRLRPGHARPDPAASDTASLTMPEHASPAASTVTLESPMAKGGQSIAPPQALPQREPAPQIEPPMAQASLVAVPPPVAPGIHLSPPSLIEPVVPTAPLPELPPLPRTALTATPPAEIVPLAPPPGARRRQPSCAGVFATTSCSAPHSAN